MTLPTTPFFPGQFARLVAWLPGPHPMVLCFFIAVGGVLTLLLFVREYLREGDDTSSM